jgi:hypothetical protein
MKNKLLIDLLDDLISLVEIDQEDKDSLYDQLLLLSEEFLKEK